MTDGIEMRLLFNITSEYDNQQSHRSVTSDSQSILRAGRADREILGSSVMASTDISRVVESWGRRGQRGLGSLFRVKSQRVQAFRRGLHN